MINKVPTIIILFALSFALVCLPTGVFAQTVSDDAAINEVMQITNLTGASDLYTEAQTLVQKFVDDPNNYGGMGVNFTSTSTHYLYYRGTITSTMAMLIPLVPGSVSDTNTLKGKLAARLKTEVTQFLFNQNFWSYETQYLDSSPPAFEHLTAENPRKRLGWNQGGNVGAWWEKMHAIWAYAYYSGDWTTIQNNWIFIKGRYQAGDRNPANQRSMFLAQFPGITRVAVNDLANGLIAYTRMADRMSDSTAATARSEAKTALAAVLSNLNVSWRTPVRGDWAPGYNLTPELGRYINNRSFLTAQTRLDEAANDGFLKGHWWTGFMNNFTGKAVTDEDGWAMANLSHELFLGRAWVLQESGAQLRPVKPWHTIMGSTPEYRDMLYIRSLYALTSQIGSTSWAVHTVVPVTPPAPSTGPSPSLQPSPSPVTFTKAQLKTLLQSYLLADQNPNTLPQDGKTNMLDAAYMIAHLTP